MYADHSLRLAQEVIAENFFLCLLRQTGKGGGKFRMVQNGGLVAGGKKIFFKLLRLGKLEKLPVPTSGAASKSCLWLRDE